MQKHRLAGGQSAGTSQSVDGALRPTEDLVATVDLRPRLAQIDTSRLEENCILPANSDDHASRAYKILRTRLLQRLNTTSRQCIGVTGTMPGEGKTFTAINLSIALARDVNTQVVLVDVDLQRPAVADRLGMKFDRGLTDYLNGKAELNDVLYSPGIDRLTVLPNSPSGGYSSELLSSPRMDELLRQLRQARPRQIVVLDLPPLLSSDDVIAVAPRTDGMILVVSQGLTERSTLANAREVLQEMDLIGVVLNRSEEANKHGYGYYSPNTTIR
jgi:capsular exopolysaccharide synthesis family protein